MIRKTKTTKRQYKRLLDLRKTQEIMLFNIIKKNNDLYNHNKKVDYNSVESVGDISTKLGINYKRVFYILNKWTCMGIYNWGVNIYLGWLEKDEYPELESKKKEKQKDIVYLEYNKSKKSSEKVEFVLDEKGKELLPILTTKSIDIIKFLIANSKAYLDNMKGKADSVRGVRKTYKTIYLANETDINKCKEKLTIYKGIIRNNKIYLLLSKYDNEFLDDISILSRSNEKWYWVEGYYTELDEYNRPILDKYEIKKEVKLFK